MCNIDSGIKSPFRCQAIAAARSSRQWAPLQQEVNACTSESVPVQSPDLAEAKELIIQLKKEHALETQLRSAIQAARDKSMSRSASEQSNLLDACKDAAEHLRSALRLANLRESSPVATEAEQLLSKIQRSVEVVY